MPGNWLCVGDEKSESLPSGWHDEIVCHTMRRNNDGSITVIALVNVYDDKGTVYSADRVIKLRKGDNKITGEPS